MRCVRNLGEGGGDFIQQCTIYWQIDSWAWAICLTSEVCWMDRTFMPFHVLEQGSPTPGPWPGTVPRKQQASACAWLHLCEWQALTSVREAPFVLKWNFMHTHECPSLMPRELWARAPITRVEPFPPPTPLVRKAGKLETPVLKEGLSVPPSVPKEWARWCLGKRKWNFTSCFSPAKFIYSNLHFKCFGECICVK